MTAEYTLTPEELGEAILNWLEQKKIFDIPADATFQWECQVDQAKGLTRGDRVHWDSYRAVIRHEC